MLKVRIYLALFLSFLGMILGVLVIFRGSSNHYRQKLIDERVGVLLEIAQEVEEAEYPKRRLKRIIRNLDIDYKLTRNPKTYTKFTPKKVVREGRTIVLLPGRGTPMSIELSLERRRRWLVIYFPSQLEDSRRRIVVGFTVLVIFGGLGAWGLGRWSIRPLETAATAMHRIAKGDLSHRVVDPIGPAGTAFNEMAERLEYVIEGQRDFMAAIGHELRTPISRMKLQLAMMEGEERASSLTVDVEELEDLVESLLESARLHRGGIVLSREATSMKQLFLSMLATIDIGEREVSLLVEENCIFIVDRRWFRLVIRNLLSNIVRYTKEDVHVWMGAKQEENTYVLWVADSGEGVDASIRSSLFDPFVRVEKSRNKVTGGLGLGLMIVRQVAEVHGGHVQAKESSMSASGLEIVVQMPKV